MKTEAIRPHEREMFIAREVMRLGKIQAIAGIPAGDPARDAIVRMVEEEAATQFDYVAACTEYMNDPAFYNAVERIRCHLTAALEAENAWMREALEGLIGGIDLWNEEIKKIVGRYADYSWITLEEAREVLAKARLGSLLSGQSQGPPPADCKEADDE